MILHQLRLTSSTLAKQSILKTADEADKQMFYYAYHPDLMYYQRFENIRWDTVRPFNSADRQVLEDLLAKTYTGNAATDLIVNHCAVHGDLIKLICNKDLACGVSITTLNSVFGTRGQPFIPKFQVQLADEGNIDRMTMPVLGQLKYNGTRVLAIVRGKSVTLKTRNGKQFSFPLLESQLAGRVPSEGGGPDDYVLDGELCFGDSKGTDHTKVSGIVNSAIKGSPIASTHGLVYNVFDILDGREFREQRCTIMYRDRLQSLTSLIDSNIMPNVRIAKTWQFDTREEVAEKFDQLLNEGYEGLIIKRRTDFYNYRRDKTWLKLKLAQTCDLTCVDYIGGKGRLQGMIGGLVCEGEVLDKYEGLKKVKVVVGTGLSDAERGLDPNHYIDSTIEVGFNKVILNNATGEWSLFLPKFICVRGDK